VIDMAVTLPTATDVRKAREQAARNATEQAKVARTPLLAVLGAGEYALSTVSKAAEVARLRAAEARTRAAAQAAGVQHRAQKLREEDLRADLRRALADLQKQAEVAYADLARRGEATWGRIRQQPQVKQAIATVESYTEKLDAQVDGWVDDVHDAAEKALTVVTRQTRSTGERVAQATQRVSGRAAVKVTEASAEASKTVADTGAEVAAEIAEAGAEVAHETRSTTRKAANHTAPKTEAKPAARKPAARRTNGSAADKPGDMSTS
jgi:heparin binding hemagglutinin HbhA